MGRARNSMTNICGRVEFEIVNVVATASLDRTLNPGVFLEYFPSSVIYDPDSYPPPAPAYIKTPTMTGKISIFHSGKMICVGNKSVEAAKNEIIELAKKLEELGVAKLMNMPKIENIVALATFNSKLDLDKISKELPVIYEPDQFSGIIYHPKLPVKSNSKFLIFSSGKVICVGLKKLEDIKLAYQILHKQISKFLVESRSQPLSGDAPQ